MALSLVLWTCVLSAICIVSAAATTYRPYTTKPTPYYHRTTNQQPNVRVRLRGGPTTSSGRVEVYYLNQWGTVCDDNFSWKAAAVVCSMLGLPSAGAVAKSSAYFGQGTGRIWLDEVRCVGNELSIDACSHYPWSNNDCSHSEDVGVVCSSTPVSRGSTAGWQYTTAPVPRSTAGWQYATTGYAASTTEPAQYRTHYGNSGTIGDSHYGHNEMTYYHHIDNPHNYPVVLHFSNMNLENCNQCSCESVDILPHDFPYDTNVQKFCGSSLPNGNGHVYVQRLGTIAFHAAGHYRSSSFSLRYELLTQGGVGAFGTTTGYGYSTSGGGRIGKSKLVQMLMNMHNQLDALSGEAKLAYDLANENYINNYAKRSVRLTADDTPEDTAEDTVEDVEANVETQEGK